MENIEIKPEQAAKIALDAYKIEKFSISQAMGTTENLSLKDKDGVGFRKPSERFTGRSGIIKKEAGFGYVAKGEGYRSGQYLVAMRGTTGIKLISRDWQTNYRINTATSKTGHQVHAGFQSIFEDFLPMLIHFFKGKRGTIHIVGHSLGGALATLIADYFAAIGGFDIKLYTFGAPRVGFEGFCTNLTKNVGRKNIFRLFHNSDPVTMIAPYPYVHAPVLGMNQINWGLCIPKPGRIVFNDHGMGEYVDTASKYASWRGLQLANMSNDIPWEAWLQDAAQSRFRGVIQFGAKTLQMLSDCIHGLIQLSAGNGRSAALHGLSAVDQLAWILHRGALTSLRVAESLKQVIQGIFHFLGRQATRVTNLSYQFVRWVFNLLYGTLQTSAERALNMLA